MPQSQSPSGVPFSQATREFRIAVSRAGRSSGRDRRGVAPSERAVVSSGSQGRVRTTLVGETVDLNCDEAAFVAESPEGSNENVGGRGFDRRRNRDRSSGCPGCQAVGAGLGNRGCERRAGQGRGPSLSHSGRGWGTRCLGWRSSSRCSPTGSTRWWVRTAGRYRRGSGRGWRSRERCWRTRRCWCWTRLRARWTRRPRRMWCVRTAR